ncbi:MAG: ABC transporter ATP-binding protein [Fimbriimonas ginsengisoli]|uniref:ABC transporter ATP-binding protein n=1 Tax=Fimbriimonas ginsengisoli TaxID=1005039 RepID=A0A931LR30_FIMGI|nr:ABC transporter ATP-binding protein [Fimbriimonas ginsengisoli]
MSVATTSNLTVKYGTFTALSDITLEIPEGCVGLLGPNGAGKTTLLKAFLGFLDPAAGSGTVLGLDIQASGREIRQRVGLMPEQDCHIPGMTAVGFVAFAGELAGMPSEQALRRAHEVLEYCGLGEARYRNVETYSTGMKQRIKLAQAIVHGPKLLLLDEPTNGLDPAGRVQMLDLIRSVTHGKGVNAIVSSHLLPDVERVCDHVLVLAGGKVRSSGLIKELKRLEGHPVDVELREASEEFARQVEAAGAKLLSAERSVYRIQMPGLPEETAAQVMRAAQAAGAQVRGFHVAERSLEEAFMEALGG